MKSDKIKEIIRDFLHNEMSDEIQRLFRRWMTAPTDRETKDAVLLQFWTELLNKPSVADYRHKLSDLNRRIDALEHLGQKKRRISLRRFAVAAALLAFIVCGEYLFLRARYHQPASICLVTAQGSKGEFLLPDGTRVWLNGNSRLVYPETFDAKTRKVRLDGNAFFKVAHDAARPFVVDMEVMQIEVLGTEFDVRHRSGNRYAEAILKTGRIQVSAEVLKKPLPMQADQRLVFDTETGKIRISTVSADDYCSWTADHLVFANKPLSEILVNLENWYNVRFRYEKDTDLSEKLSFHLKYEPLEETMHILSRIARIEYEIRGNEVFLVPAR